MLDNILELEVTMEELALDPEAVQRLAREKKKIEKEYERTSRALADLETEGLSLKNEVLQEIISKKINSVFVPVKEEVDAETFARMELDRIDEMEEYLKHLMSRNYSKEDKQFLQKTLEQLREKKELVRKAMEKGKKTRASAD